jgi:radical SAM protein with 4Fe4S-binding SPASM domain
MEKEILPKLDLNVTNKCNFRCKHCAFDSGIIKMKELSLKKIKKILKDTKKFGGRRFDITGGEPLVRKDIDKIIIFGKKLGYKIELVTNASLLNKTKLKIFRKLGLDAIAISLDGSSSRVYNFIRRKNRKTFEKVINNIKNSVEEGFHTKINTTVFRSNLKDIENIINLGLKLKVNEVGFYYFTPVGRGNRTEARSVEPIKWLKFIRKNLVKYKDSKIKISLETPFIEKEKYKPQLGCVANNEKSHLQILPNGNVYPCAILASYSLSIANLNKVTMKKIWMNKKLWRDYWKKVFKIFKKNNNCCVDFYSSFNLKKYDKKYFFICPLRKFKLEEML